MSEDIEQRRHNFHWQKSIWDQCLKNSWYIAYRTTQL